MSAICGILQQDLAPVAADRCRLVQAALEPYGRHAQGLWDGGHVALGSRLMRRLPEDAHDHQPLHAADGRFVLVADIRLDNREDLGRGLGIPTSRLSLMADADVLLAAYERWDQGVVDHLLGDYAFAVWDCRQRRLFLARDHLGRSPLFHHQGPGWFGFASMPAGLLALPGVRQGPDHERIRNLLFLMPDISDHSYFAGIHRLLPGHAAVWSAEGGLRSWCYWAPSTEEQVRFRSDDDYVEAFHEKLDEAVRCRLRSTGGIASHASAGFDGATVSSIAAHRLAQKGATLEVFTAVPNPDGLPVTPGTVMDESALAAQVAALFPNIRHHRMRTDGEGIVDMLGVMFALYNRPAKNVVNLLWDMAIVRQAAALGCSTLLIGELGNFTISYDGSQALNSLLREGRLFELSRQIHGLWRSGYRRGLDGLYRTLMPSLPLWSHPALESIVRRFRASRPIDPGTAPLIAVDPDFRRYCQDQHLPQMMSSWQESRLWRRSRLLRHDFAEYAKGTLALAGIDRRDPTVDIRLVRYCLAIPVEQFNKDGVDRWLLRRALRRHWPAEILASRTKGMQAADTQWRLQKELEGLKAEIQLQSASPDAGRYFDLATVDRKLSELSSRLARDRHKEHFDLLRLIAAGHFMRLTSSQASF